MSSTFHNKIPLSDLPPGVTLQEVEGNQNEETTSKEEKFCASNEYIQMCADLTQEECEVIEARGFAELADYLDYYGFLSLREWRDSKTATD